VQEGNDLKSLEKEMWGLKKKFLKIIEPYRSDLWKYCRSLTRDPWDAEDLVQETLLKAFASLGQIWQPLIPKSYLFRIATNTWLNQIRKNKYNHVDYQEEVLTADTSSNQYEVHEAVETLVGNLPPRQVVAVLLVDVFDFTAREAGEMMGATEGAIKAVLHRGRTKLKSLHERGDYMSQNNASNNSQILNQPLINAFTDAFNRRDPEALVALLAEDSHIDIVHVGQEYGRETSRKWSIADDFKDPTIHLQHAEQRLLWGLPVVVILINDNDVNQLHDIMTLEVEDDYIISIKNYYFCQDLLHEASTELNIPLQTGRTYMMD
jgi:RNA polymerase sigma factor (sigma-70 family)